MIVMLREHPLAGMKSVELGDVAEFPWVFFERRVHPSLHDGILRRMQEKSLHPRIRHHVTQADQVPVILGEDSAVAWLTPAGAERIVGDRLIGHTVARSRDSTGDSSGDAGVQQVTRRQRVRAQVREER